MTPPIIHPRRKFLRLLGGGVILAAGAGGLAYVSRDPMPESALSPWDHPGHGETDPRKRALAFALLAPNPHNLQSWLVALPGTDEIVLYCDRERLLPQTDPFSRQIMIGHGAFLELLDLAANSLGYETSITLFPEGEFGENIDARPVARIRFTPRGGMMAHPLFAQVLARRSHKDPFDMKRAVPPDILKSIAADVAGPRIQVGFTSDSARLPALRQLASDAMRLECETPRTLKESIDLLRIGSAEIARHRDGISLHGPMIWWLKRFGLLTRESCLDPKSGAFQSTVDALCENAETAMGFMWLSTPGNQRTDQIDAGRAYVRMNLHATALGLQMHPMSQALQEYPEMAGLREELNRSIKLPAGHTLQMFPRVGYAEPAIASPRRGLASHLIFTKPI